jgi:hypothetical protein
VDDAAVACAAIPCDADIRSDTAHAAMSAMTPSGSDDAAVTLAAFADGAAVARS